MGMLGMGQTFPVNSEGPQNARGLLKWDKHITFFFFWSHNDFICQEETDQRTEGGRLTLSCQVQAMTAPGSVFRMVDSQPIDGHLNG